MTSLEPVLFPVLIDAATDPLVKAVAAYLARYRGQTRVHTESDLRAFLVVPRAGCRPLAGLSGADRVVRPLDVRYDRARKNLDRHPNYILAAYMASGT